MQDGGRKHKHFIDSLGRQVYGPYLAIDKRPGKPVRRHVIVLYGSGRSARRKNISFARWAMEHRMGRELLPHETVDHIDGQPLNDTPDNYQLMSQADKARKWHDARRPTGAL